MYSRPDTLAKALLDRGQLTVDPDLGAVYGPGGNRVEILDKRTAYGRVYVYGRPTTYAQAHRIVWMSVHGMIPKVLFINHLNRRRYDNRITNLELVTPAGNVWHHHGKVYDAIGAYGNVASDWTDTYEVEPADEQPYEPYRGDRDKVHRLRRVHLI